MRRTDKADDKKTFAGGETFFVVGRHTIRVSAERSSPLLLPSGYSSPGAPNCRVLTPVSVPPKKDAGVFLSGFFVNTWGLFLLFAGVSQSQPVIQPVLHLLDPGALEG